MQELDRKQWFGMSGTHEGPGIANGHHPVRKGDRAADSHQEVTLELPERTKGCQASCAPGWHFDINQFFNMASAVRKDRAIMVRAGLAAVALGKVE